MSYPKPPRGYGDDQAAPEDGHVRQGTSRWLDAEELEDAVKAGKASYRSGDIFLGRSSISALAIGFQDDRHAVLIAQSRGYKGVSTLVPNASLWPGSMVSLDPKGEQFDIVSAARAEKFNQRQLGLDPFGVAGGQDGFNFLDVIDPSDPEAIEMAGLISAGIVLRNDEKEQHFNDMAEMLIRAVILLVAIHPLFEGHRHIVTVKQLLTGAYDYPEDLFEDIDEIEQQAGASKDSGPPRSWVALITLLRTAAKMIDGPMGDVFASAATTLTDVGPNERGSITSTLARHLFFCTRQAWPGSHRQRPIGRLKI